MQVDHIVVGHGICGALLARSLQQHGKQVLVIDNNAVASSSKVASGIINPVTGKRLVRSWMTEELLPFAWTTYKELSEEWGLPIVQECGILDFHLTHEQRDLFAEKQVTEQEYLQAVGDEEEWQSYFRFNYGIGAISPSLLISINTLLAQSRKDLLSARSLIEEEFSLEECMISKKQVAYKDIVAHSLIFCDGVAAAANPYFDRLPWSKDKGEVLIVSIPGLPRNHIFKQGISIVPWGADLFWVGASHDWKFTDLQPSAAFRKRVEEQLDYWLKLPYTIIDHLVAQRPANLDRKPFVGLHPVHNTIGIFNGMGSKGCSLAPYFADQFARYLAAGTPILPAVDVKRFTRVLSQ